MVVGAKQLQVSESMVVVYAVGVMKLQWNKFAAPLLQPAALTTSSLNHLLQLIFEAIREIAGRVLHHSFRQGSLAAKVPVTFQLALVKWLVFSPSLTMRSCTVL